MKETPSNGNSYNKIRGWLILVAVPLLLNIISMFQLTNNFFNYNQSAWVEKPSILSQRINPDSGTATTGSEWSSQEVSPQKLFLLVELLGILALFLFSLVLPLFFIQRRKFFPRLMIFYFVCLMVILVVGMWGLYSFPGSGLTYTTTNYEKDIEYILHRAVIGAVLIAYLLYSKRAKSTFVR